MEIRKGPGRVADCVQRPGAPSGPRRGAAVGPEAGRLPATPPLVAGGGPGFSLRGVLWGVRFCCSTCFLDGRLEGLACKTWELGGGCSLAFALRARRGDRRDVLIIFLVSIAVP